MAKEGHIAWPPRGKNISGEQYKELREYAFGKGIVLKGFKKSDVDVILAKELIDDAEKMLKKYPRLQQSGIFTMELKNMHSEDFAYTVLGMNKLSLNINAVRDKSAFMREYNKLMNEGFFVRDTDYHSVIFHEFGHLVGANYGIDGLELMKKVLNTDSNAEVLAFCRDNLSEYSAKYDNGIEIISEIFSAHEGGRTDDFILTFMRESGILK